MASVMAAATEQDEKIALRAEVGADVSVPAKAAGEAEARLAQLPGGVEQVSVQAWGWRGWMRAARIARVLGTLSLYLYMDGYDIRAGASRPSRNGRETWTAARWIS
jgi:hypothetical protein